MTDFILIVLTSVLVSGLVSHHYLGNLRVVADDDEDGAEADHAVTVYSKAGGRPEPLVSISSSECTALEYAFSTYDGDLADVPTLRFHLMAYVATERMCGALGIRSPWRDDDSGPAIPARGVL